MSLYESFLKFKKGLKMFKIEDINELRESVLNFLKDLGCRKSLLKQVWELPDEELLKLLNEVSIIKRPKIEGVVCFRFKGEEFAPTVLDTETVLEDEDKEIFILEFKGFIPAFSLFKEGSKEELEPLEVLFENKIINSGEGKFLNVRDFLYKEDVMKFYKELK